MLLGCVACRFKAVLWSTKRTLSHYCKTTAFTTESVITADSAPSEEPEVQSAEDETRASELQEHT